MASTPADQLTMAFETHYEELVAHVFRKVQCRATAVDIVQEAFVRISIRELPKKIDNPRAFLYRVAGNLALDHLRFMDRQSNYFTGTPPDIDPIDRTPSPETALADKQRFARLLDVVEELPPRCREVFVMNRFHSIEQNEIADRLGISRTMVNRHLRQALLHCAKRLREETE